MKTYLSKTGSHLLLSILGFIMIYPLIWLISASFKPNNEVFSSISLIPSKFVWESYVLGWKGIGKNNFGLFFGNTLRMVIPTVIFTVVSSFVVAYGFARFHFPLKKVLFFLMISTLMLPEAVLIIPRYLLFQKLGWLNTYYPFIVPAIFSTNSFFIFMLVQFLRGIPRDLDEAAQIDGYGSFAILTRILAPLSLPSLFSVAIFQFIWTWNEFFNVLIYISSVKKFTVALGLMITLDSTTAVNWNQIMAMSVLTVMPLILIFFFAQRYFVEGVTTSGLKG